MAIPLLKSYKKIVILYKDNRLDPEFIIRQLMSLEKTISQDLGSLNKALDVAIRDIKASNKNLANLNKHDLYAQRATVYTDYTSIRAVIEELEDQLKRTRKSLHNARLLSKYAHEIKWESSWTVKNKVKPLFNEVYGVYASDELFELFLKQNGYRPR